MKLVYTNNFMAKKEIVLITPFKIAERNLKYYGINITKIMEDLYNENYKTLKKSNRIRH